MKHQSTSVTALYKQETISVRILPDGRMDRENAALYLGLKPKTLAMWAMDGKGPRMKKVGSRCFYFKGDLDAFIADETEG